jgi:hypothetical protein
MMSSQLWDKSAVLDWWDLRFCKIPAHSTPLADQVESDRVKYDCNFEPRWGLHKTRCLWDFAKNSLRMPQLPHPTYFLVCFMISSVPPPSNFWWQGLQNNGLSSQTHIFGLVSTCRCKAQYKYETSILELSKYTLTRTYSSLKGCAFYPHSPCFAN